MGSALEGGWGFQWEGQGQNLGVLKLCYHSELNFPHLYYGNSHTYFSGFVVKIKY